MSFSFLVQYILYKEALKYSKTTAEIEGRDQKTSSLPSSNVFGNSYKQNRIVEEHG